MSLMSDEIRETPEALARLLDEGAGQFDQVTNSISKRSIDWVSIVARGTSDHAAIYARYLIESKLGIPVTLAAPSLVSVYRQPFFRHGGLVLAISQSGRSPDLIETVEAARAAGLPAVTITNHPNSPLALSSTDVIDCMAGEEKSVAATKTYTASLLSVAMLVESLRSGPSPHLRLLPDLVDATIDTAHRWVEEANTVEVLSEAGGCLVVGRGYNLSTALEAALKLIETSGVLALGYSAADLEHGPLVLARKGIPVLIFHSPGVMGDHTRSLLDRLSGFAANLWTIGPADRPRRDSGSMALPLPCDDELSPIPYAIPGQVLAETLARRVGLDPDSPPGLGKETLTL